MAPAATGNYHISEKYEVLDLLSTYFAVKELSAAQNQMSFLDNFQMYLTALSDFEVNESRPMEDTLNFLNDLVLCQQITFTFNEKNCLSPACRVIGPGLVFTPDECVEFKDTAVMLVERLRVFRTSKVALYKEMLGVYSQHADSILTSYKKLIDERARLNQPILKLSDALGTSRSQLQSTQSPLACGDLQGLAIASED